jgi:putative ABC transport system permease protein
MRTVRHDIKRAWSRLSHAVGFVLTVVITLGLTLGALVCVFGLNWLLLMEPLPYPDQDRLVYVKGQSVKEQVVVADEVHVYPILTELYNNAEDFSAVALISYDDNVIENLANTPRMDITYVSPEYFSLLATPMALGRTFSRAEGVGSQVPVAVISYRAWQRYFMGSQQVLGQKITLGKTSFSIIGVVAEHFEEPQLINNTWKTQLWLPWDFNERRLYNQAEHDWSNSFRDTKLIAKLKAQGADRQGLPALSQKLTQWMGEKQRSNTTDSALRKHGISLQVELIGKKIHAGSHITALLMFAGVFTLLCIAGTNITNLFFARSAQTQRDFAIQSALGAKPGHLFRLMFFESLLVMLFAALLGGVVAVPGMELLIYLAADHFPRIHTLSFGWIEVVFLLLTALSLAVFFAWLVCRQIDYRLLMNSLQSSGKGSGLQISKRTRQGLIISQVVLAGILLTATLTLLGQSLQLWLTPEPVQTEGRYLLRVNIRGDGSEALLVAQLMKEIKSQLPRSANVVKVSQSSGWPYAGYNELLLSKQGDEESFSVDATGIDESWISLFDVRLLQGRNITRRDLNDNPRVLLVNQAAAKLVAQGGGILGRRLFRLSAGASFEVVGVVEDIALPGERVKPRIFHPRNPQGRSFSVQAAVGQELGRDQFSQILTQINSRFYVSRLLDWNKFYDKKMARDKLVVGVSLAVSLLTLFLVGIGLYGILSYQIRLRRFELGVRMAIGAKPSGILKFIVTETLKPAAIGLVISFGVGMGLYLFYLAEIEVLISRADVAWILPGLASLVFILSVILLTCYLPLRNLIHQPPIFALRDNSAGL